jgi:hypothetical protein
MPSRNSTRSRDSDWPAAYQARDAFLPARVGYENIAEGDLEEELVQVSVSSLGETGRYRMP